MVVVGLNLKRKVKPMNRKLGKFLMLAMWANTSFVFSNSIRQYRKQDPEVWDEVLTPERPLPVIDQKAIDRSHAGQTFQEYFTTESNTGSDVESTRRNEDKSSFLKIERSLVNMTKNSGDNVRLRCEARGHPQPYIRWYKNEAPLEEERGRIDIRHYSLDSGRIGSKLKINHLDIHDMGYYKCEASNGPYVVDTTAILIVKAGRILPPVTIPDFLPGFPHFPALGGRFDSLPTSSDDDSVRGLCQIYRGITCSQLIRNRTVYVKSVLHQSHLEEKLAAAITVIATSQGMSTDCHKYIIPLLCYFAFPICDDSSPHPVPRKVCRHECELLQSGSCDLREVQRHPLVSKHNVLPVCEELPPLGSPESANCIPLGLPNTVEVRNDDTCYIGNGVGYRGIITNTTSGVSCQQWNSKVFEIMEYPELIGGHSYCRNPGGMENQPWCFTNNPHHHKEFCSIPKCVDYFWIYILIPIVIFLSLIGLLISVWCIKQKKQPETSSAKSAPIKTQSLSHQGSHQSQNEQQMELNSFVKCPLRTPEISLMSVRFLRVLGEGTYGKSYQGEVLGATTTPVFIKSLHEKAEAKFQQEFQKEAEAFSSLHHPNIVCLLGVCSKEEPFCIFFEYCFRIDLREYLIRHSPRSESIGEDGRSSSRSTMDLLDVLHICKQIASGMDYLSSRYYVHRDLAARNCLVGDNLSIKICEFGAWRNIYTSDYYPLVSERPMPVRWMPPESIVNGKFTTESDVWSYGVVMWEIFSYGIQPYFGHSNQEVVSLICSHQLLPCPKDCPRQVHSLMKACWHEIPSHRPTFKELLGILNCWPVLYLRTPSFCHSISTHNGSSTGPSNTTRFTSVS